MFVGLDLLGKLFADDGQLFGSVDTNPHSAAADLYHSDRDRIANQNPFANFSRNNQHLGEFPFTGVRLAIASNIDLLRMERLSDAWLCTGFHAVTVVLLSPKCKQLADDRRKSSEVF